MLVVSLLATWKQQIVIKFKPFENTSIITTVFAAEKGQISPKTLKMDF